MSETRPIREFLLFDKTALATLLVTVSSGPDVFGDKAISQSTLEVFIQR